MYIVKANSYFARAPAPAPAPAPVPARVYWLAIARARAIATVRWESPVANIRNVIIIASCSAADIGICI